MAKKPETRKTETVNLLFKCPVGKSVPGGPYYPDRQYNDLGAEVYENPLVKSLIKQGMIMVLSDVESQTGTVLAGNLDDATKKAYAAVKRAEEAAKKAEDAYAEVEKALAAMQEAADPLEAEETAEMAAAMAQEARDAADDAKKEADGLSASVK